MSEPTVEPERHTIVVLDDAGEIVRTVVFVGYTDEELQDEELLDDLLF